MNKHAEAHANEQANEALCRDCHRIALPRQGRCRFCRGPRLIAHKHIRTLHIAHIDCDAFFAAVEKRDQPELLDKPLIIGGGQRGVVSTCCYNARMYGVRSAMPMFQALKKCPHAVVIRPNGKKYGIEGRRVRALMQELTPLVEPLSIDEAFLDLSGTESLHGAPPASVLSRLASRIEADIGITVSIGLSDNKFLAKTASDLDKPRGFAILTEEEAPEFLAEKKVSFIYGVGKAFENRLNRDGIYTIRDLQRMDAATLAKTYGQAGLRLTKLCWGQDSRPVKTDSKMKSVSTETTFNTDIRDFETLRVHLRHLSEKVSKRLKEKEIAGFCVTVKLKTKDFKNRTRSRHLSDATQLADRIFRTGEALLAPETGQDAFRLLGIGVSDLVPEAQADGDDLVDTDRTKRAAAEHAMDKVREKFGDQLINVGMLMKTAETKPPREENED